MIVVLMTWSARIVYAPKIETERLPNESNLVIIGGAVKAMIPPVIPEIETSAVLVNSDLIDCLIRFESSGNPKAEGAAGEKGILQFMPSTFERFCVKKYGLKNDIWDVSVQRDCADRMISAGLIYHWTTAKFCNK